MSDPKSADRSRSKLVLDGVPSKRWWKFLLKTAGWLSLTGATGAVIAVTAVYYVYADGLPAIPKVDEYWPPIVTEVYTDDAVLAGEFYEERRKVVPYERIPKRLVQAFIASEDSSFFDHFGVDVLGTARAGFKTVSSKLGLRSGGIQGGSTLTQQTAKAVLISAEGYKSATAKTLTRKIREAILARRLEESLTKEEILYLYLNNVFLGHHSYGVQSAAENYYRKDVRDLTLGEMTLIAGLPQAPSRYSPFLRPEAARKRRSYVLRRMLVEGMISQEEHDTANAEEVKVYPVEDVFHEFAPYFVEQVRKDVVDRYGNPVLLKAGLKVFTTMDSERQRAAQDAVLHGLLSVDKRQGWRGPVEQLASKEAIRAFVDRSKKLMGAKELVENRLYVAVVTSIDGDGKGADVQVGGHTGRLPLLGMRWARKVNPEGYYPAMMITSVKKAISEGDVVVVRHVTKRDLTDDKEQWDKKLADEIPSEGVKLFRLEQTPEAQSALVSIDPHRQYLTAMVGGYDFDDNEFNRAFQACRQPGSSFKPFVYSAALEQLNWTQATVLVDSPIVEHDPDTKVSWKPANYSDKFEGEVLLRTSLVNSLNVPAVKTFGAVGVKNMAAWTTKLGITTPMNMDFSAALGSSCVYPVDLANAYATFNRYGRKKPTYFIRKIEDRWGRTLEDHTAFDGRVGAPAGPRGRRLRAPLRAGRAGDEPGGRLHPHAPAARRGAPGHRWPRAAPGQAGGGKDGHHQRLLRRVVRRLHPRPGDGGVGGLRPEPASAGPLRDGRPRRAPHLAQLHEERAGGPAAVRVLPVAVHGPGAAPHRQEDGEDCPRGLQGFGADVLQEGHRAEGRGARQEHGRRRSVHDGRAVARKARAGARCRSSAWRRAAVSGPASSTERVAVGMTCASRPANRRFKSSKPAPCAPMPGVSSSAPPSRSMTPRSESGRVAPMTAPATGAASWPGFSLKARRPSARASATVRPSSPRDIWSDVPSGLEERTTRKAAAPEARARSSVFSSAPRPR